MGLQRWELYYIENGSQSIGAGVYHPQPNKTTTVNPGGTSNNKTMNRAELAGNAVALIHHLYCNRQRWCTMANMN
jgi:hypothetical protein